MLHFYKTPVIFRKLSKKLVWKIQTPDPVIFLTFDDGPIPGLTEYVLDILADFDAKATFFCVGDNMYKHPAICEKVVNSGHFIGNHTYHHLNGWSTKKKDYVENIEKCQSLISNYLDPKLQPLFRPPYGKISRNQINSLSNKYRIIMWNILTYDFDKARSPEKSLHRIIDLTIPGSIVVFHDNYKAEKKLEYMLPRYLMHFKEKGYTFKTLSSVNL